MESPMIFSRPSDLDIPGSRTESRTTFEESTFTTAAQVREIRAAIRSKDPATLRHANEGSIIEIESENGGRRPYGYCYFDFQGSFSDHLGTRMR